MTTEIKRLPVDLNSVEFLLWQDDKVVDYGDLDDIKEVIAMKIEEGDGEVTAEDFVISLNNPLEGVSIEAGYKVTVEMRDKDYSEESEEFIITRNGREIDSSPYEDEAMEKLAELIEEADGQEDLYNLERKLHYYCTYDIDKDYEVKISIPNQPIRTEVIYKEVSAQLPPVELMADHEIQEEINSMYKRIQELSVEKDKRLRNTF